MDPKADLAKALFELDKQHSVFSARCEQQWRQDKEFRVEVSADLKELKKLVTDIRIKRAADTAVTSLVVSGGLLLAAELLRKLVG